MVLETDALPVELLACEDPILAGLSMGGVLMAPRAILLHLHAIGSVALVLIRCVVTTLALGAGESDHCAHESSCR